MKTEYVICPACKGRGKKLEKIVVDIKTNRIKRIVQTSDDDCTLCNGNGVIPFKNAG